MIDELPKFNINFKLKYANDSYFHMFGSDKVRKIGFFHKLGQKIYNIDQY